MATRTVHRPHFSLPHYGHTRGSGAPEAAGHRLKASLAWRLRAHLALLMVIGLVAIPALILS
jgi:hypothetical protein